jgi:hypothetical protein
MFYHARGDSRPDALVTLVSADARTQMMVRVPDATTGPATKATAGPAIAATTGPAAEAITEATIDGLVIRDGKPLANVSCRLSTAAAQLRTLHACGGTAAIPAVSFAVPARAMIPDTTPEELASVVTSTSAVADIGGEHVVTDGGYCRAGCDHRTLVAQIGCLFQNPVPYCFSRAFRYDVACYLSCPG